MVEESGTRYTIDELLTLHTVAPDEHEILTEGRRDASLLQWFFDTTESSIAVFAVSDRINIDFDVVIPTGLDFGEKAKVVATAKIVNEDALARDTITCVVDADYWHSVEDYDHAGIPCLLATDYTSMEMYCFNEYILDKFLRLVLRAPKEIRASNVLTSISSALVELYLLRWCLKMAPGSPTLPAKFLRSCSITGGVVRLNSSKLIVDALNSCSSPDVRRDSGDAIELSLQHKVDSLNEIDRRKVIGGHDFSQMLCFFLKTMHPEVLREDRRGFIDPSTTELTLIGCLTRELLAIEPLFKALVARVTVSTA